MHEAGYRRAEAYTPFPVTGLSEALGFRRTWVAAARAGRGGLVGAGGGFFMQWFANVVHFPWNIGGRPLNSWPAFIPITFEMRDSAGVVSGVFGMLALNRLPQPFHPLFRLERSPAPAATGFSSASRRRTRRSTWSRRADSSKRCTRWP